MTTALILGRQNGVGLDRDANLLAEALRAAGVECNHAGPRSMKALLSRGFRADIAFHLERVSPWWRRKAGLHFLIPNQERFPRRLLGKLGMIDQVLCKSQHAMEIFRAYHRSTGYLGFTSKDRQVAGSSPDYSKFFHLAGKSTLKNTEALLALWSSHPEWPELTLVQHPLNAPDRVPPNVHLINSYLPDDELRSLQNLHGVHLCPSLSEGWGHYVVEAMSCQAVVLVTDAPPMNELISADRGVPVAFDRSEPRHLGWNFHVEQQALETAIQGLIAGSPEGKAEMGQRARAWFEHNHHRFQSRIGTLVHEGHL